MSWDGRWAEDAHKSLRALSDDEFTDAVECLSPEVKEELFRQSAPDVFWRYLVLRLRRIKQMIESQRSGEPLRPR